MSKKRILYYDRGDSSSPIYGIDEMDAPEGAMGHIQIGPVPETDDYLIVDECDIPTLYDYLRFVVTKYSLKTGTPQPDSVNSVVGLDLPAGWHRDVRTLDSVRRVKASDDLEIRYHTEIGWTEFCDRQSKESFQLTTRAELDEVILALMKLRSADGRVVRTIADFEVRLSEASHRGGSSIWNVSVRDKLVGSITQSSTTGEVRETSPRWETSPQGVDLGSFANEQAAAIWLLYREGYYSQKRALTIIEELER